MFTLCQASSDVAIPVVAKAMYFSTLTDSFKVIFNIDDKNKSNFSSITIESQNSVVVISTDELNIISFSELDSVELLKISGKETMYIRIIDYIGDKKERREDRLYFEGKHYVKRVTLFADDKDKVKYLTKMKGEVEAPGYK